jgi:hypothetical protein
MLQASKVIRTCRFALSITDNNSQIAEGRTLDTSTASGASDCSNHSTEGNTHR